MKKTRTAEFVSPKHPDKICDYIADGILDAYLKDDKNSRVAVEVMGGHNLITINGEVTSGAAPELEKLVKNIVGKKYKVIINLSKQSPSIAHGVDIGGAGDQGIMKGYATSETESMMPKEYELARNLCMKIYEKYPHDGKVQVTVKDTNFSENSFLAQLFKASQNFLLKICSFSDRRPPKDASKSMPATNFLVKSVVVSFQNTKNSELLPLVQSIIKAEEYLINPAGEWTQGGFDADTGLSGRKIVIDNYGPEIPIGGGSFSGKDYTKVDRSGAYMARKIAVDLIKNGAPSKDGQAREAFVKLAYAIGKPEPVMAVAMVVYADNYSGQAGGDGKEMEITGYDLTPRGIKEFLNLDKIKFAETSQWGHFGRDFPWDK